MLVLLCNCAIVIIIIVIVVVVVVVVAAGVVVVGVGVVVFIIIIIKKKLLILLLASLLIATVLNRHLIEYSIRRETQVTRFLHASLSDQTEKIWVQYFTFVAIIDSSSERFHMHSVRSYLDATGCLHSAQAAHVCVFCKGKGKKGKGMFLYSAVSSPLDRSNSFTLFLPWQTCSFRHQLGFSWKHSSHAPTTTRSTFPPISIVRYSFIQLSDRGAVERTKMPKLRPDISLPRGIHPSVKARWIPTMPAKCRGIDAMETVAWVWAASVMTRRHI